MPRPTELSIRAIAFGLALGILLAAANVYVGLKLGFIDAGTTTIILLAFALSGGRFTAQETNIAQAAGSSASTMALTAGLLGPIPALAMSGGDVSPIAIVAWGCALGVFGTLAAIPFRVHLIEIRKLAFPTARAAGEVIRKLFVDRNSAPLRVAARPGEARAFDRRTGIGWLAWAAAGAAAVTVARDGFHAIADAWIVPVAIAGVPAAALSLGAAASPLLLGVGLLVGARVGLSMLLGAAIAWVGIAPQLVATGTAEADYGSLVAWTMWPGSALIVASSLTALALGGRDLARGARGAAEGATLGRGAVAGIAASAVAVIAIGWFAFGVGPIYAALAIVLAAAFAIASMHATGETDNTPAGPLGGLAQVVVGAVGPGGVATPLYAGGVVNGIASHSAQMLDSWKTGSMVDGAPRPVLVAQLIGIAGGVLGAATAYWLIVRAYGVGNAMMSAAAAQSWKATADAVAHGTQGMPAGAPWAAVIGAAAGIALAVSDRFPRARRFAPSAIAMGIGFILPASVSVSLALGAIGFAVVARVAPGWFERIGPAFASGLIVGEGLAGVATAAVTVASAG